MTATRMVSLIQPLSFLPNTVSWTDLFSAARPMGDICPSHKRPPCAGGSPHLLNTPRYNRLPYSALPNNTLLSRCSGCPWPFARLLLHRTLQRTHLTAYIVERLLLLRFYFRGAVPDFYHALTRIASNEYRRSPVHLCRHAPLRRKDYNHTWRRCFYALESGPSPSRTPLL